MLATTNVRAFRELNSIFVPPIKNNDTEKGEKKINFFVASLKVLGKVLQDSLQII